MKKDLKVTYIQHSGFLVETETSYLLFDYWKGDLPDLSPGKKLYVFASHFHHDHYTKEIFDMNTLCCETYYILSFDIENQTSAWKRVGLRTFVKPWEKVELDGCQVETFDSTDEGVAFLVSIDGWTIFHAGDLHWWDWPGEPEAENYLMRKRFCAEIDLLKGRKIDVAFVVLDPRQEESGGLGMDYFTENVDTDYIFPMHGWEDYGFFRDYYEKKKHVYKDIGNHFMMINEPGQTFEIKA